MKDNCVWLNNKLACEIQAQEQATVNKALSKKSTRTHIPKKLITPQILDQSEGDKICGPDQRDLSSNETRIVGLIETICSQYISAQSKIEVMQRAVAQS